MEEVSQQYYWNESLGAYLLQYESYQARFQKYETFLQEARKENGTDFALGLDEGKVKKLLEHMETISSAVQKANEAKEVSTWDLGQLFVH